MPLVPLAALALLLGTFEPSAGRQPPSCNGGRGRMTRSDGSRTTIVVSDVGRCLEVRMDGRVTFDDADADVQSMEPGTTFVAAESRGGTTRVLTLQARDGAVAREYRVNGAVRPAAEGAEWFRGIVLELVRQTGVGAEARVARLRRQGGTTAVLDELREVGSDHVRQRYLELLLGDGATAGDVERAARFASERIGSDHGKASVLRAAVDRHGDDPAVAEAVVSGTTTIGSDHERGAVLRTLAARETLGRGATRALLRSAAGIGSDHEKALVLLTVATRPERLRDPAMRAEFQATLRSIGSDHEYRRVAAIFER